MRWVGVNFAIKYLREAVRSSPWAHSRRGGGLTQRRTEHRGGKVSLCRIVEGTMRHEDAPPERRRAGRQRVWRGVLNF